jgi:GNAT superfamily N-acetyltransferase
MPDVAIALADPAGPPACTCLAAYYAELDRRFPGGFTPPPLPDPQAALMTPPLGAFLIAGDAMGCVALLPLAPGVGEVKRLWVAPPARGTGLARRLMAAVEDQARDLGLSRLRLDTSAHLPDAVAMYRRWGWTAIARYNDNPHAHHWFDKPLRGPP